MGEIEIFDAGPVKTAFKQRQARRSHFQALSDQLGETSSEIDPESALSIRAAMKMIGGREKPWGPALVAMTSGKVTFHLKNGSGRFADRILIEADQLDKIVAMDFDRSGYPRFAFESLLNRRDSEELLNLNPHSFSKALKEGHIKRPRAGLHARNQIAELSRCHISRTEILARWSHTDRRLPYPIRNWEHFSECTVLGWHRGQVEERMAAWSDKQLAG